MTVSCAPTRTLRPVTTKSGDPFHDTTVEHDSGDHALCLPRAHDPDTVLESLRQFTEAAAVLAPMPLS